MIHECPECGSRKLFLDRDVGEIVCRNCGLVVEENVMDVGPEWRAFTPKEAETRKRVGMPISHMLHDKGLSTKVGSDIYDAHGQKLTRKAQIQAYRLRKHQKIASINASATNRNMVQALNNLNLFSDKLSIPYSVRERAAVIYRKSLNRGLVRGRSISAFIAASLYAALRLLNIPRTLEEISEAAQVRKKDMARCYRLIVRELNIKMPVPNALTYLSKLAEKTQVSNKTVKVAVEILRKAEENHVSSGQGPRGLAAAALYIASKLVGEEVTQSELAMAAGVTDVTVRSRKNSLCRGLGINLQENRTFLQVETELKSVTYG